MASWLVARVLSNLERVVSDRLERIGFESYFPRFRSPVIDRRTHRRRAVARPLYPCYVFVRTSSFYCLLRVDGVTSVVMHAEAPAMSDRLDAFIEAMRSSERDGFVPAPEVSAPKRIVVGGRVIVVHGLLRGYAGTCSEIRGNRAQVDMRLLGVETPVWHSECDLAAA